MRRRWWAGAPLVVVLVAAALRIFMPGPTIMTTDELSWITRSARFDTALKHGDFASANVGPVNADATRPGVTTMWIGAVGAEVAARDPLDVNDTLRYDHLLMGVVCSLLLWPFILVAARLVGRRAAVVAGGLMAIEPLMVGHSAILHTDALVAITTEIATVAAIAAFEALRREAGSGEILPWWRRTSVRLGAVAGAAAALACLTKLNAVIVLGAVVLAVVAIHVAITRRAATADGEGSTGGHRFAQQLAPAAAVLGVAAAVFTLVTFALWPALWIDPLGNLRAVVQSGDLASTPSRHLFDGSVETGGDWRLYPVELVLRASPWLLIGAVLAAGWKVARWVRREPRVMSRRIASALLAPAAVYAFVLVTSDKQYSRYLLPLLPIAALGVGVAAASVVRSMGSSTAVRAVGWTGFTAAALATASLAPYPIAFVDPLLGGQRTAEHWIQLGWGEGKEVVVEAYLDRAGGGCPSWSGAGGYIVPCPPQSFDWLDGVGTPPHYVFRSVFARQLGDEPRGLTRYLRQHGHLVKRVMIDGVSYAELWRLRPELRQVGQ
jgi:hypothetical protein